MIVLGVDPGNKMTAVVLVDLLSERIHGRWYMPNQLIPELVSNLAKGTNEQVDYKNRYILPENIPLKERGLKKGVYNRIIYDVDIQEALGNEDYSYPVPEFLVMEMVGSYSMAVGRTTFETCAWIGAIVETFCNTKGTRDYYTLITRTQSRRCIAGTMKSGDAQVNAAIRDRIGEKGTKKNPGPMYGMCNDLSAALSVAITFKDFKSEFDHMMKGPQREDVLKGNIKLNPFWTQFEVDGGEYGIDRSLEWEGIHNK